MSRRYFNNKLLQRKEYAQLEKSVLVTWVARNNDPFETRNGQVVTENGEPVFGPTLGLLLGKKSLYRDKISHVHLFYRTGSDEEALDSTRRILKQKSPEVHVHKHCWHGADPTDHKAIYHFACKRLEDIKKTNHDRELIFHISPGTPAMHTIWVLMVTTGMVGANAKLVKSYRSSDKESGLTIAEVDIEIDTYFKAYQSNLSHLKSAPNEIIWDPTQFRSQRMKEIDKEARRFAQLKTPVLILGERGTGKSSLALWIRINSPFRRQEHWSGVACGQFDSNTMRSELFGHITGAYTGAISNKDGLLKRLDGDTLFLDEIGDIDRETQRLLIKAIEEKKFQPLGGEKFEESDFRLITATNTPLEMLETRIDPDFFDRINSLTISLPCLHEIPEEIPWIWRKVFNAALFNAAATISPSCLNQIDHRPIIQALQRHPLPGNLRDVYRVAYRLIACLNDCYWEDTTESALEYALQGLPRYSPSNLSQNPSELLVPGFSMEIHLASVRNQLIKAAMERTSGNMSQAAKVLGISPQAVQKHFKNKQN